MIQRMAALAVGLSAVALGANSAGAGVVHPLGLSASHEEGLFVRNDPSASGSWKTGEAYHGEHKLLGEGTFADYEMLGPVNNLDEVDVAVVSADDASDATILNQATVLFAFAGQWGAGSWVGNTLGGKSPQSKVFGKVRITVTQTTALSGYDLIDVSAQHV